MNEMEANPFKINAIFLKDNSPMMAHREPYYENKLKEKRLILIYNG
jgi:hypothetical protein